MAIRKIELMHRLFGKSEGNRCGGCKNLERYEYGSKNFKKCTVYGVTQSIASDWALKYEACGLFNKDYSGTDVINYVRPEYQKRIKDEDPIEGQERLWGDG